MDAPDDETDFQWVTRFADGDTPDASETAESSVRVGLSRVESEPLGGWDAVPDDPPPTASAHDDDGVAVPAPPRAWRDGDPTGADWWRLLTRATLVSVALLVAWSLPVAALDATARFAPAAVSFPVAAGLVGLAAAAAVTRFVVVPLALSRDARLVAETDAVRWSPDRRRYLLGAVVFTTGTCLYYLYQRSRHVGNPRLPVGERLLRYEGQRVASNWWAVVAVAVAAGTLAGGAATRAAGLPVPVRLVRTALGGPLLSLAGAEAFVTASMSLPRPVDVAVGGPALAAGALAAFLRLVALPVALYADATAVRRSEAAWEPLALWYAVTGWVFAVPTAVVYLGRRYGRTRSAGDDDGG
ncbi:hypothetical protein [Halobaculum sp. MBLA0143]|uniref:hypothetical protein n=1 Tax=Halobaculum sp. MBLA0143 TaxID=3079933 RepID=UPI0035244A16